MNRLEQFSNLEPDLKKQAAETFLSKDFIGGESVNQDYSLNAACGCFLRKGQRRWPMPGKLARHLGYEYKIILGSIK